MELNIVLSSGRKTHNKAKSKQNIITDIIIPSCFAQDYVKETFFTYHDVTWGKCENKLCHISNILLIAMIFLTEDIFWKIRCSDTNRKYYRHTLQQMLGKSSNSNQHENPQSQYQIRLDVQLSLFWYSSYII